MKRDLVGYAFPWNRFFALIGLIISAVLAFAFAIPLGILIGRLLRHGRTQEPVISVEPE